MANNRCKNTTPLLECDLGILEEFSTAGRPLGITDPSRHLGMRFFELGHLAMAKLDVRDLSQPVMTRLHDSAWETAPLMVLCGQGSAVFFEKPDSTKATLPQIRLGAREVSLAMGCRFDVEVQPESAKPPVPKKMAATTGARGQRSELPISN